MAYVALLDNMMYPFDKKCRTSKTASRAVFIFITYIYCLTLKWGEESNPYEIIMNWKLTLFEAIKGYFDFLT